MAELLTLLVNKEKSNLEKDNREKIDKEEQMEHRKLEARVEMMLKLADLKRIDNEIYESFVDEYYFLSKGPRLGICSLSLFNNNYKI